MQSVFQYDEVIAKTISTSKSVTNQSILASYNVKCLCICYQPGRVSLTALAVSPQQLAAIPSHSNIGNNLGQGQDASLVAGQLTYLYYHLTLICWAFI